MPTAACTSFAEAAFFASLSKYKLDTKGLDESPVNLIGFAQLATKSQSHPTLRLDGDSIHSESHPSTQSLVTAASNEVVLYGTLVNFNTIQAFKDYDKAKLAQNMAANIAEKIRENPLESLCKPHVLAPFSVISFADLKKYRYLYWFCFPGFAWRSIATEQLSQKDSPAQSEDLNINMAQWFKSQEPDSRLLCSLIYAENEYKVAPISEIKIENGLAVLGAADLGSDKDLLPWYFRNVVACLYELGAHQLLAYLWRPSGGRWLKIDITSTINDISAVVAWERNHQAKLAPKLADLSTLLDPMELASQATDLNLKLMKWRAAPKINLEGIKSAKVLLLGAGTLGCYVARGLVAWGVRHITFVDNGKVSYSNPVRQPLYELNDSINGSDKAQTAAQALTRVFPGLKTEGHTLSIPMAGHPENDLDLLDKTHTKLRDLIGSHDVVFLLLDSRESRWLPTVIAQALEKLVINVAIGFDSFVVMRHGLATKENQLGCYFCNDVVAPIDSLSGLTLDQMCTVTRPGMAALAAGNAVELFATVMQHKKRARCPHKAETCLGPAVHQLRGFLRQWNTMTIHGEAFANCSACGSAIINEYNSRGVDFVSHALNDPDYLTELSGLGELQRATIDLDIEGSDDEFD